MKGRYQSMDFRAQIDKLRADKNGLLAKLEALGPEGKVEEINAITGQMKDINRRCSDGEGRQRAGLLLCDNPVHAGRLQERV